MGREKFSPVNPRRMRERGRLRECGVRGWLLLVRKEQKKAKEGQRIFSSRRNRGREKERDNDV